MNSAVPVDPQNSFLMAEARIICRVCQRQFSQYTCPRCNARYCSLPCYKKHSTRCTESFMRENVMEGLRHMGPDNETKKKMVDLLKRFHSDELDNSLETEVSEDDYTLSEETIQKILTGDTVSLNDLSIEESKQFQRAVASGELCKLIEPWNPWWLRPAARTISLSHEGAKVIQPVTIEELPTISDKDTKNDLGDIPSVPEAPLHSISQLMSNEPSPLLGIHLLDVIYTYCFTLRLYNGEWQSDPIGASSVVLSMSAVLGEGGQPETVSEALAWCLEQTCSQEYRDSGGLRFGFSLFDDVICLVSLGRAALVTMLSDLHMLIEAALRELKAEKNETAKRKSKHKIRLKSVSRKVYFLMCWVNEQTQETWSSLTAVVELEKAAIASSVSGDEHLKIENKGICKPKVLIEEF